MLLYILVPLPQFFETGNFNVDTVASTVAIASREASELKDINKEKGNKKSNIILSVQQYYTLNKNKSQQ